MPLTDAIDGYLLFRTTRAAEETIKTDLYNFKYFLKFITPTLGSYVCGGDIKPDHIRAYIDYDRDRGISPFTVHRSMRH